MSETDSKVLLLIKQSTLERIRMLAKHDEKFAIDILDILLDEVWEKNDMIDIINETCPSYETEIDMNADDTEHEKAYEADIMKGLR